MMTQHNHNTSREKEKKKSNLVKKIFFFQIRYWLELTHLTRKKWCIRVRTSIPAYNM